MAPARVTVAFLFVSVASAVVLDYTAWGPSDSVHALDAVITAVNSIVNNPHLSAAHLKKAQLVAADIKVDIEAVEAGNLTKQQTNAKVAGAIKELQAFEADFAMKKFSSASDDKLAMLKKELAEKKADLAKEESMMKLLKLKKALAEKKLQLEKMIMAKSEAAGGHKAEQERAEQGAMVSKLLAMAKNITGTVAKGNGSELPAPLKAIVATLQAREHVVSDSLEKIVAAQTKADAEVMAIMKAQNMQEGSGFDAKKQKMFKHLKTEEDRKFAKVHAVKQNELNELRSAEKSTEARDVVGLTDVLTKMQRESRKMQAKSGNFLH